MAEAQKQESLLNKEIVKALENGIKAEAERIYDRQKQEAIKEFDRRKDEVLAGITLHIMKMMDIQWHGDRIIITLLTKKDNT